MHCNTIAHGSHVDHVSSTRLATTDRDTRSGGVSEHADANRITTGQHLCTSYIRADVISRDAGVGRGTQRNASLCGDDDVAICCSKATDRGVVTVRRNAVQAVLHRLCPIGVGPNEVSGDRVRITADIHPMPHIS